MKYNANTWDALLEYFWVPGKICRDRLSTALYSVVQYLCLRFTATQNCPGGAAESLVVKVRLGGTGRNLKRRHHDWRRAEKFQAF